MKIGLIDYGRGNLRSVEKAFARVASLPERVDSAQGLMDKDLVVLPGVGAFGDAMKNLHERALVEPLRDWLRQGRPFVGLCLGYQLLFEGGEESPGVEGLGVIPGRVIRFDPSVGKVPHMGWNQVVFSAEATSRLGGDGEGEYFYHVHSFYPAAVPDSAAACRTTYGNQTFVSGVMQGDLFAVQFHPEKSQSAGLGLLRAWLRALG